MSSSGLAGGITIGNLPSPSQVRQKRSQAMTQAFEQIHRKSAVIKQQADRIVEGERARQDNQRAELFHLFDIVG